MENENDGIPIEVEAQLEPSQPEIGPERRGFASLRGVRRSTYLRRSLRRMLTKSPEELAAYKPANGYEEMAKHLVSAPSNKSSTKAQIAIQAWKEVKETLGERIGSRWKDSVEEKRGAVTIINDLPWAVRNQS
jgi:hypothetical protein